ncbi:ABC transporter permease [Wenyingzhuangia sp. IMCC45574]
MINTLFIKIFTRFLVKNKLFTIVNILGLSLGIVSSLLLLKYVSYHTSFDNFFDGSERIYRVSTHRYKNDIKLDDLAKSYKAVAPALENDFSEVEAATRLIYEKCLMDYREGEVRLNDMNVYWGESSFLKVFNLKVLEGDTNQPLSRPFTTIISKSTAAKYFKKGESPIGKIVNLNGDDYPMEITAVFENIPSNSHLPCDFVVSWATGISKGWLKKGHVWKSLGMHTYFRLKEHVSVVSTLEKITKGLKRLRRESIGKSDVVSEYSTIPIKDVYLKHNYKGEIKERKGVDEERIQFLVIISIIIMVVTWINYVNLSTGKTMDRVKEIGVKKSLGATKQHIAFSFFGETFIISVLSFVLSVVIIGGFKNFTTKEANFEFVYNVWNDVSFWVRVISLVFFVSLLSSLYPAFVLSRLVPFKALKGKSSSQFQLVKKGLVLFQFIVAVGLISSSLIVFKQLQFMKQKPLGFHPEKILLVKAPKSMNSHQKAFSNMAIFKQKTEHLLGVEKTSASMTVPGQVHIRTTNNYKRANAAQEKSQDVFYQKGIIDESFFETYEIPFLAGRNFTKNLKKHKKDIIINEKACKALGFKNAEEAVHQQIRADRNSSLNIIGVVKNYHQLGLQSEIIPTVYFYGLKYNYIFGHFSLQLSTNNHQEVVSQVKTIWNSIYTEDSFVSYPMQDYYNLQYEKEDNFMNVFLIATFIAILICALGLYALSAFAIRDRIKEVGVRKVLGATVLELFVMLSKDFLKVVVLSIGISIPVVYILMNNWLQNFAYQIEMPWEVMFLGSMISVIIALVTISYHVIKASWSNVVLSLKTE